MTVEIHLQGSAQAFAVSTDGDPWFVADEIRKMASSGDGLAVLTLQDGSLLLVDPRSTWIRLRAVAAPAATDTPTNGETAPRPAPGRDVPP